MYLTPKILGVRRCNTWSPVSKSIFDNVVFDKVEVVEVDIFEIAEYS